MVGNSPMARPRQYQGMRRRQPVKLEHVKKRLQEMIQDGSLFNDTDLVRVCDVAERLGVTPSTIRKWVRRKHLRGHIAANRIMFLVRSDFDPDYLQEDGTFTIRTLSVELGITRETIRRWIKTGKLSARKFGNRWIITKTDLQDFLDLGLLREK